MDAQLQYFCSGRVSSASQTQTSAALEYYHEHHLEVNGEIRYSLFTRSTKPLYEHHFERFILGTRRSTTPKINGCSESAENLLEQPNSGPSLDSRDGVDAYNVRHPDDKP